MRLKRSGVIIVSLLLFYFCGKSQDSISSPNLFKISLKYAEAVDDKLSLLDDRLDRHSAKTLKRLKRTEEGLKKKLSRLDSATAIRIFGDIEEKYVAIEEILSEHQKLTLYIPFLDTLNTSLRFLKQHPQLNAVKGKMDDALSTLKQFESGLQKAESLKQFLKERHHLLKEQLENLGFAKELKKINKEVYYYTQQLNEYKVILNDPKRIERKAIELLSKAKLFEDFMRKNSLLSSLFRLPSDDPNDPAYAASLTGLQTRNQVQQLIQNQVAIGGPDTRRQITQSIQSAQTQLQQLKDKVDHYSGSYDDIMPQGFKPNNQKSKSLFQRLELGANFQTSKSSNFFPVTSDLGLSLGYKLNDKSVIGVGASYKLGLGTGWRNIDISHQGVGLRSFIDWKLKGSFWISGGYEQNYRSEIRTVAQLNDSSAWQQSGLIGLSKIVSTKSKLFRKTKLQVLWDFLSYRQMPRSKSIIFRIGYSFN